MEVKTTKVSSKGQVIIPQDMRKLLGLKQGDTLLVYCEKDAILLKKVKTQNLKREFLKTFEKVNKKILEMGITEEEIIEKH